MAITTPSTDEIAERGERIYDAKLRDLLEPDCVGKFVAIDVNTGEYALGDTMLAATDSLMAKVRTSDNYIMKVGYSAAVSMGGGLTRRVPKVDQ